MPTPRKTLASARSIARTAALPRRATWASGLRAASTSCSSTPTTTSRKGPARSSSPPPSGKAPTSSSSAARRSPRSRGRMIPSRGATTCIIPGSMPCSTSAEASPSCATRCTAPTFCAATGFFSTPTSRLGKITPSSSSPSRLRKRSPSARRCSTSTACVAIRRWARPAQMAPSSSSSTSTW